MRSRWSAAVAALVLLAAAGCSPRDHDNLFDPKNEDTNGHPDLLEAVAGDGRVELSWDLPGYVDLTGFELRRTDDSGTTVDATTDLPPDARSFTDSAVTNDSTYSYSLVTFFSGRAQGVESPPALATPGRRVIWVLDQSPGSPVPVSPDGRNPRTRPGGTRIPSDLSVMPSSGDVVTVDFYERKVDRYDRSGARTASIDTEGQPLAVAVDPSDGTVWIGTYDPSILMHRSADLATLFSADSAIGIPEDIALDTARGTLWLADFDGRLLHRRADGQVTAIAAFDQPFSVAIDPPTGDCWLADRSGPVFRVSARGDSVIARSDAFAAPYQVISDAAGGAWVTDSAAGRIVRLDAQASVIATITTLRNPGGIARDPLTPDLWITELREDELVRLDPADGGAVRFTGYNGPFEVRVVVPDP